jgi:hypothetical protein
MIALDVRAEELANNACEGLAPCERVRKFPELIKTFMDVLTKTPETEPCP